MKKWLTHALVLVTVKRVLAALLALLVTALADAQLLEGALAEKLLLVLKPFAL